MKTTKTWKQISDDLKAYQAEFKSQLGDDGDAFWDAFAGGGCVLTSAKDNPNEPGDYSRYVTGEDSHEVDPRLVKLWEDANEKVQSYMDDFEAKGVDNTVEDFINCVVNGLCGLDENDEFWPAIPDLEPETLIELADAYSYSDDDDNSKVDRT
jgi:hypothetical protein